MSGTTNFTLYVFGASYYSVRVEIGLAEKGINYDCCTINGFICENLEPWYMKMNPTGKVLTLMHGDKSVCGSAAILKYLDDEFPETVSLYPDKQSPLYDQIKQFEELVDSYFLGTLVGGCYKYPKYVPKFGLWDHNCCKNIWMEVFNDNFSSADIYLVVFLKKMGAIGFSSYWEDGKHPFVAEFFKRLEQRPSVKEVFKVYDDEVRKIREFQIKEY
uniref:Ganglioside-induced differentiation-associated protein 1-like n=1 Tax=Saccoglossus kowalevskii TaxID=10224 RepID=A0ABM0M8V9_SACKO|nr:PREDICTED: ganglioside-induced differentiation-associated protein 1-like [Saccoglossus kowalevskii]